MIKETINPDKMDIRPTVPVKKQKYLATLRPKPGQKLFRLNLDTAEIDAPGLETSVSFSVSGGKPKKESKLQVEKNCLYCVALNKKNAEKKFIKMLESL